MDALSNINYVSISTYCFGFLALMFYLFALVCLDLTHVTRRVWKRIIRKLVELEEMASCLTVVSLPFIFTSSSLFFLDNYAS